MATKCMPNYFDHTKGRTYCPLRILGRGAFGAAFAVQDSEDDTTTYCLKEIGFFQKSAEDRKVALEDAAREVNVLKVAKHPNVISYFGSWFSDRQHMCILMELAPNGDLGDVIELYRKKQERFPEQKITHYLQELAGALDYVHNTLRVVHRDLKPANVLVDQLGSLKLADFGLSKHVTPDAHMTVGCGTPLYCSLEQLVGPRGRYSYPTDVWALGCITYELMALRSPWDSTDIPRLVAQLRAGPVRLPTLLQHYSSRLVETTRWMLEANSRTRATAAELVEHLSLRAPPTGAAAAKARAREAALRVLAATQKESPRPVKPSPRPAPAAPLKSAAKPKAVPLQRSPTHSSRSSDGECEMTVRVRDDLATVCSLERQRAVVDAAAALAAAKPAAAEPVAAALAIQRSFRLSAQRRRLFPRDPPPADPRIDGVTRPLDRAPFPGLRRDGARPVLAKPPPTRLAEPDPLRTSALRIQHAFRSSLNGRRRDKAGAPTRAFPAAGRPAQPSRLQQLATPRPRAGVSPPSPLAHYHHYKPPVRPPARPMRPRPAWV
jgi:serine/threonine protein kinase